MGAVDIPYALIIFISKIEIKQLTLDHTKF